MIKIKAKYKAPELKLVLALGKKAIVSDRKKGFAAPWQTEVGEVQLPIPEEIDPDSPLGQQLEAALGRDISEGVELADFEGKKAFLLLAAKRTSGGKFHYSIEAILAPEIVRKAAESLGAIPQEVATSTQ